MEAVIKLKTSLTNEVEKRLNAQVRMEAMSSQFYLSCASWCDKEGYENAANFLYTHAEEERVHQMKIFKYINEVGGHALVPPLSEVPTNFESLRSIFGDVLEHEVKVSRSINNLADFCFQSKDFGTFQFLQWFVEEQREEEALARRILDVFDLIGEEGQGRWMIEQEIGKISAAIAAAGSAGA